MFSRKQQSAHSKKLPEEWRKQLKSTIEDAFKALLAKDKLEALVFSELYQDEVVIIISLVVKDDPLQIGPNTFFISADLESNKKMEKLLKGLIDSIGVLIDNFFENKEGMLTLDKWEEADLNGNLFFYKINNENIHLSLEAERILKNDSENN